MKYILLSCYLCSKIICSTAKTKSQYIVNPIQYNIYIIRDLKKLLLSFILHIKCSMMSCVFTYRPLKIQFSFALIHSDARN